MARLRRYTRRNRRHGTNRGAFRRGRPTWRTMFKKSWPFKKKSPRRFRRRSNVKKSRFGASSAVVGSVRVKALRSGRVPVTYRGLNTRSVRNNWATVVSSLVNEQGWQSVNLSTLTAPATAQGNSVYEIGTQCFAAEFSETVFGKYLMRDMTAGLTFTNMSNVVAHLDVYLAIPKKEIEYGDTDSTPVKSLENALTGLGSTTKEKLHITPYVGGLMAKDWHVRTLKHFVLNPGQEAMCNVNVYRNRVFSVDDFRGAVSNEWLLHKPYKTAVLLLRVRGSLGGSATAGQTSNVGILPAYVGVYCSWSAKLSATSYSAPQLFTTSNAAFPLNALGDPMVVNDDSGQPEAVATV